MVATLHTFLTSRKHVQPDEQLLQLGLQNSRALQVWRDFFFYWCTHKWFIQKQTIKWRKTNSRITVVWRSPIIRTERAFTWEKPRMMQCLNRLTVYQQKILLWKFASFREDRLNSTAICSQSVQIGTWSTPDMRHKTQQYPFIWNTILPSLQESDHTGGWSWQSRENVCHQRDVKR